MVSVSHSKANTRDSIKGPLPFHWFQEGTGGGMSITFGMEVV